MHHVYNNDLIKKLHLPIFGILMSLKYLLSDNTVMFEDLKRLQMLGVVETTTK